MSQTKQQHIKKIAILKTQNDRAVLDVTRVTVLFVLLPIAFPLCCFTGIPSPLAVPHVEPWFGLGKRVHPKNFVNLPECEQPQGVLVDKGRARINGQRQTTTPPHNSPID